MKRHERVLSIYPNRTGFTWAAFEGANHPIDWGVAIIPNNRNTGCLKRIARLLDRLRPFKLLLEEFEGPASRRKPRVQVLCGDILKLARAKEIRTVVVTRHEINKCFETDGVTTRYEIARVIAKRIEAFAYSLPPRRKIWLPEDPRMGLFNAAAVALAHYRRANARQ